MSEESIIKDPEFFKEYISEKKRIPLYLQKVIRENKAFQNFFIEEDSVNPISKKVFGTHFGKVQRTWNKGESIEEQDTYFERETAQFFAKFYEYYLRNKTMILVLCYGISVISILQGILMFWFWTSK